MVLHLALSCLQGRRQSDAAVELIKLGPPGTLGLQLTPGCFPNDFCIAGALQFRTHHGFTTKGTKARVWDGSGRLVWSGDSVHPPLAKCVPTGWEPPHDVVMETMYPGYADLASGLEIEEAMDAGRTLAVDVSHIAIQRHHGVIVKQTIDRLFNYDRIAEIHVSASRADHDSHGPIDMGMFGIAWARERSEHIPIILEVYMHRMSTFERLEQIRIFG